MNPARTRPPASSLPLILWTVTLASTHATATHAFNCEPHAVSTCIDSNQQWLSFSGSRFVAIQDAALLPTGTVTGTLAGVYQARPITVTAPSQTTEGRDIAVVDRVLDTQVMFAGGLGYGTDVGVALRLVSHQTGAGAGALRTRHLETPARSAIRDPLIGFGVALPSVDLGAGSLLSKLRLDLSLPFGDAGNFAGERAPVAAPTLVGRVDWGSFHVGAQLGARLRRSVGMGDFRYQSQLVSSIGLSFDAVPEWLVLSSEWLAAPGIRPQARSLSWIPAEWSASIGLRWSSQYTLSIAGGTALPLSSQALDAGHHDTFAGLGSPAARFVAMLRVTND